MLYGEANLSKRKESGDLCLVRFCIIFDVSLDVVERTIIDDNRGAKQPQIRFWISDDFWLQRGFHYDFAFTIEAKSDAIIHMV
jgi:hypothetical protein